MSPRSEAEIRADVEKIKNRAEVSLEDGMVTLAYLAADVPHLLDNLAEVRRLCDDAEARARFIARDNNDAALTVALVENLRAVVGVAAGVSGDTEDQQ